MQCDLFYRLRFEIAFLLLFSVLKSTEFMENEREVIAVIVIIGQFY